MAIQFQCGNCQNPFSVQDELAGKRFKCKKCGQPVTVPQPEDEVEGLEPLDDEPQAAARSASAARPAGAARPPARAASSDPLAELPSSEDPLRSPPRAGGKKGKKKSQEAFGLPVPMPYLIGGGVGVLLFVGLIAFLFSGSSTPATPTVPTVPGPVAVATPAANVPVSAPPVTPVSVPPVPVGVAIPEATPPQVVPPATVPEVTSVPPAGVPPTVTPAVLPTTGVPAAGISAAASVPLGPSISKLPVGRDMHMFHPGSYGFANARPVGSLRSMLRSHHEKYEPLKDGPVNLGTWKVQPDPLAGDDPAAVPVAKRKVTVAIPAGFFGEEVTYAPGNARYAALGANVGVKDVREFWDLAEMKKLGSLTGVEMNLISSRKAISPDGRYFVASNGSRPAGIGIWTTAGRLIKTIPVDETPEVLDFAGPKSLYMRGSAGTLRVWKIPTVEKICDILSVEKSAAETMAVSPGGRFLIQAKEEVLTAYDLTTGENAGTLSIPKASWRMQFEGMAWSRDGQVVACLYGQSDLQHVLILDVATGNLIAHHPLTLSREQSTSVFFNKGIALDWSPDSSMLLVQSQIIVGRRAGGPLWTGPVVDMRDQMVRRFLSTDRLLFVRGEKGTRSVQEVPLPSDEIAAMVRAAEQRLAEAAKPAAAPVPKQSLSGVRVVSTKDAVAWNVAPDSAAPLADVAPWTSIGLSREKPTGVVFATNSPTAATWRAGGIDLYDTATGQTKGSIEAAFDGSLLALSPDGDLLVTQSTNNEEDRLDLWSVADKKSLANWKPYQSETPDHMTQYDPRQVTGAAFIDSKHLFTLNVDGKLVLWSLPDCKPIYQIQKVHSPMLSPGGKYVAVGVGSVLRFFTSRSATPAGELNMFGTRAASAFDRDGARLATLIESAFGYRVVIWNLKTGSIAGEFPIPSTGKHLHWCGPQHLLLDGKHLVDTTAKCVVWRYETSGTDLPDSPDGRHWYLASGGGKDSLCAISLPEPAAAARLAGAQFPDETVVRPGSEVGLQIGLAAMPPDQPNFVQTVTERFQSVLKQNEVRVSPTAPIQLTVGMTMTNTGKNMEFKNFNGTGATTTLGITQVDVNVSLVSGGQPIWTSVQSFTNQPFSMVVRLEQGEDLNAHCAKSQWAFAGSALSNYALPTHIFSKTAGNGLGKTALGAAGAGPAN